MLIQSQIQSIKQCSLSNYASLSRKSRSDSESITFFNLLVLTNGKSLRNMPSSPDIILRDTLQIFRCPALPTLNMMNETDRSCCSVPCPAITRSFRSGTANSIWDSPLRGKKRYLGTPFYPAAMAFFDDVLVCISLPISQVLRGSSYFSIVCSLTGCHWIAI